MLKGTGKAYRQAKRLRRELTLPEILLWRQLRRRGTGYKWRKQHPAGPYTLDFYCDATKLSVEVDGAAHERGDRPARDERRDAWLAENGVETLRIQAVEVLRNLDGVLAHIAEHARKRAPLHRPSDGPPPPAELGED
jgi:very-short-patch-repair endonuclease